MPTKKEKRIIDKVWANAGKAIDGYGLLENKDRILVGLSGGIDSFVLLDVLAERMKHLPVYYELEAVHVQMGDIPGQTDTDYIKAFCKERDVKLHIELARSGYKKDNQKNPCFPCSWNRRKAMFLKAGERKAYRVAFGHHMDDALETLFMNMVYHGEYSAFPPKLSMFNGEFDIIRPMMMTKERDIERYAEIKNIHAAEADCPYADNSKREEFKKFVGELSGKHKLAKTNLFNAMSNIYKDFLPPEFDNIEQREPE